MRSDVGIPRFPGFPHRSDSTHRPWSVRHRILQGVGMPLLKEVFFLGGGLELWIPSSVRQSWCNLELRPGIQKRDLLCPGCRRKLQETVECRGALGDGAGGGVAVGGGRIWGPSEPRPSRHLPSQLPRAALGKNAAGQDNGRTEECAGPVVPESEAGTPALRAYRNHFRCRLSVCGAKAAGPGRWGPGHGACQEEALVLGWMSRPG